MVIQDNGNVGIGTTSPGAKLEVAGELRLTGAADLYMYLYGAAGVKPYIVLNEYAVENWNIAVGHPTNTLSITNTLDGTDGIIIGSTGNVGIGTTSPQVALHLGDNTSGSGTMRFDGYSVSGAYGTISYSGDNFSIDNSYAAGTELVIRYNGNVGIGMTDPLKKLSLHTSTNNDYAFHIRQPDQSSGATAGWYFGVDNLGSLTMAYDNNVGKNENLVITTSGNVGIGTTAPGGEIGYSK